ncbi:MAG: hypothetical protein RR073_00450 [Clostridia bacterium]
MASKILIKRGPSSNLSSATLSPGEPAFTTDNGKLYIGNEGEKTLINPLEKITTLNTGRFYPKVKVNLYGQVVAQDKLTTADLPALPPHNIDYLTAYYYGGTLSVPRLGFVPLTLKDKYGISLAVNADGTIALTPGAYLINFSISSNTSEMSVALSSKTTSGFWSGTENKNTSSSAVPYTSCSGTHIRVTTVSENIGIINSGGSNLLIFSGLCSLSIVKLA